MNYICIKNYYYGGSDGGRGERRTFTIGETYNRITTTIEGSAVFIDDEGDGWPFNKYKLVEHFNCDFKFGR